MIGHALICTDTPYFPNEKRSDWQEPEHGKPGIAKCQATLCAALKS